MEKVGKSILNQVHATNSRDGVKNLGIQNNVLKVIW